MIRALKDCIRSIRSLRTSKEKLAILAYESLTKNLSFQLPASASSDRLIGFKELYRVVSRTKQNNPFLSKLAEGEPNVILDSKLFSVDIKVRSVEHFTNKKIGWFVSKQDALHRPKGIKGVAFLFRLILFGLTVSIRCVFDERRSNLALFIRSVASHATLLHFMETNRIEHVFDYSPYEVDSNWGYLLFMRKGIRVTKVPSCGPLTTHNHTLLANELVLSNQYQFDEMRHLPRIQVDATLRWLPKSGLDYIHLYHSKTAAPPSGTVGYYSHASWLRKMNDDNSGEFDLLKAEEQILSCLGKLVANNPSLTLKLFLHPKEKKPENLPLAHQFYSRVINGPYNVIESDQNSTFLFDQVDLGIGAFSTVLFERLVCGYKTIIASLNIPDFPIADSAINSICVNDLEDLNDTVTRFSPITKEEYFEQLKLSDFIFQQAEEYPE